MSRRRILFGLCVLAFFCAAPEPLRNAAQAAAPAATGALSPAPVNPTFDVPASAAARNSAQGRAGIIEPPGWSLKRGGARPAKGDGPRGGSYALLHTADATLESSAFTISPSTKKLDFVFSIRAAGERESSLQVYVLSGTSFQDSTLVFDRGSRATVDWQKVFVPVAQFAGQNVKLRFVRGASSVAAIGVTNVAVDLLETHIGRDRMSAKAGDPVNTSNGNFEESFQDLAPIPGIGVPLEFTRYYNSASTYDGSLGAKWTHTYSLGIRPEPDGSRTVRYVDGHIDNFSPAVPILDAVTMGKSSSGSASWTHTTTSASSRLLLVAVEAYDSTATLTATYGGQSMTALTSLARSASGGNNRFLTVFYLLNPASGAHTVQAVGPGSGVVAIAETFSNVVNAVPVVTTATGASGTPSVSVGSTTANDLVVDFVAPTDTPDSSQTLLASVIQSGTEANVASSVEPGQASSVTMSWSSTSYWALAGVRIQGYESPRECWRLQSLRGWSDDTTRSIPSRNTGAGGPARARARGRVPIAVGGDHLDRDEVRDDAGDPAQVGPYDRGRLRSAARAHHRRA